MSVCGDKTRKQLFKEFNGRCAYCGGTIRKNELTIDHIKPKSFGGRANLANIRPSCRFCNMYKSDLSEEDFRKKIAKALNFRYKNTDKVANKYSLVDGEVRFYYEDLEAEREDFINRLYSLSGGGKIL